MKSTPVRRTRRKTGNSSTRTFFHQPSAPQQTFFSPAEVTEQAKCDACAKEDSVQRKEAPGAPAAPVRSAARHIQNLPGRGEPMAPSTRAFFEARLGTDLSSVRIHRDPEAAQSASALHAQAFTLGENIVFNRDRFAPETTEGRQLLGHELIHVMQQRRGNQALQMKPEETEPPAGEEEKKKKEDAPGKGEEKEKEGAQVAGSGTAKDQEKAADAEGAKAAEPLPIADFATFGKPSKLTHFAKNVSFNGKTDATFDGGVGQTKNLKAVPGKECSGCNETDCVQVTGSLVINYHVNTTVTLPDMPAGLTPCQEKRVGEAINNKIKPHEDQHVAAFSAYNGTVTLPINFNGCKAGLADHVQQMHDTHAIAREAAANAQSAALDPFNVSVNLDCEDEPPKK